MLQLIDLAGSEHRIDSAEHDAGARKARRSTAPSRRSKNVCGARPRARRARAAAPRSLLLVNKTLLLLLLHLRNAKASSSDLPARVAVTVVHE